MPKVSVVIPAYNRAHYICEAIRSVLCQTFMDFELIIVDDGSTDNTREIVNSFQEPRIKYIYQENCGVAAARNTGIAASSGEYISFLDSDDSFFENALEKEVLVLDKHPEVAFCYCQRYVIDGNGRMFVVKTSQKVSNILEGNDVIKDRLIYGHFFGTSATLVRRSYLYEVGLFDPTFRYGSEDYDLFVKLAKRRFVAYIAEPLLKYRIHSSNMSVGRDLDEYMSTQKRILSNIFDDPNVGYIFAYKRSKAYFRLYLRLASHAYDNMKMKAARSYLFESLRMYPKEFLQGQWRLWIWQFGKTCIPIPILKLIVRAKYNPTKFYNAILLD